MKHQILLLVWAVTLLVACKNPKLSAPLYQTESLKIQKLSKNTFLHTTFLQTNRFGKVPCNGMIYINQQEAVIFDAPSQDTVSIELIEYVENKLQAKVKAIVVNHFHVDCLGGLAAFHQLSIPSYANRLTIELAKENNEIVPQHAIDQQQKLKVGKQIVINEYFGEGHTKDNIVSYIPSEKILFGGCMLKSMNAGKGNLNDANTEAWPKTVRKIKERYPDLRYVIPGHGKVGGGELLDFTIALFEQ